MKGTGIGSNSASGRVCIGKNKAELESKFQQGDVIVTVATDKDMINIIEKSSALIVEEGGLSSHAAIVGLSFGKPVIVGATNALNELEDGQIVTVDSIRGLVYSGKARVL